LKFLGYEEYAGVARDKFVWRRRRPIRALGRLGWTVFLGASIATPAWFVFGAEPLRVDDGALNPLAFVVPLVAAFFTMLLVPQVLALFRRPVVSGTHYALTVRPGVARTLMLPWAQIGELVAIDVDDEPYLLIRCVPLMARSGDWPRWWDKAHLRAARRGAAIAFAYDLAVPMAEFEREPEELLAELARWAPDHVGIVNRL
jgi:hypothetical protein